MSVDVSVCITTYNRASGLDRTLGSLANQTHLPDEVIVNDDCSVDDTEAVAERWAKRLPGFQYHRNARNLRMPGNLNAAIARTRGTYVANLHDADTFAPTMLARWKEALDRNPSAGFVFCGIDGWPAPLNKGSRTILHDVAPLTPGREFFESHLAHRFSSIVWGTVMARRSAYDRLLPFDDQFGFISDVDMWMRMCLHYDVAYVREPLIVLDQSHTDERGGGVNWRWVETMRQMQLTNLDRFYGDDGRRLAQERRRHQAAARRYLSRRMIGRGFHHDLAGIRQALRLWRQWGLMGRSGSLGSYA